MHQTANSASAASEAFPLLLHQQLLQQHLLQQQLLQKLFPLLLQQLSFVLFFKIFLYLVRLIQEDESYTCFLYKRGLF